MIRAIAVSVQGAFYAGAYLTGYAVGTIALALPGVERTVELIAARNERERAAAA